MFGTASEVLERWLVDAVLFVRQNFKVEPQPWQIEALRALITNNRIAMKACKGPGKTALLAWAVWWFMATRVNPKVICTSITEDNLNDNLWPELAKWQSESPFLMKAFEWKKTRITNRAHPETWFCSARTWPKHGDKTQQTQTLAGIHAKSVLFVLDESGGIPSAVMASADAALATGGDTKIMQAGNPESLSGPLYAACTSERHLWKVIEITGDPDDPNRSTMIDKKWAREQIEKYGRENPWVLVNVFGRFPPNSLNTLLGPEEVRDAMKRHIPEKDYEFSQKRLGIDPARFGDDSTVIFPRQGLAAFRYVTMRNARTTEIAGRVLLARERWGAERFFIDSTGGYGAGVEDACLQSGVALTPVMANGKADDSRYFNKRAEMWFRAAEWVKKGGALPPDDDLLRELTAPTYMFHKSKFRLEAKEQIKARLGFSPDRAEGLVQTFAELEAPGRSNQLGIPTEQGKMKYDYDPIYPEDEQR